MDVLLAISTDESFADGGSKCDVDNMSRDRKHGFSYSILVDQLIN